MGWVKMNRSRRKLTLLAAVFGVSALCLAVPLDGRQGNPKQTTTAASVEVRGQVQLADGTKREFSSLSGLEKSTVGMATAYTTRANRLFFENGRDGLVIVDLTKAATVAIAKSKPGQYAPVDVRVTWRVGGSTETFLTTFAGFEIVWAGSQLVERHLAYFGSGSGTDVFGGATITVTK